jgi:hypothetical protein
LVIGDADLAGCVVRAGVGASVRGEGVVQRDHSRPEFSFASDSAHALSFS